MPGPGNNTAPVIEMRDVDKRYAGRRGEVAALVGVNCSIRSGEFVALCGPSGSGKSTLLSLIGGLTTPTRGEVRVCDQDVHKMTPRQRDRMRAESIGFVFQLFHLVPYLNVRDNVVLGISGPAEKSAHDNRADQLLGRLGVAERKEHLPAELSVGERQRVALARALINDPPILLADEPTGNLDEFHAQEVMNELRSVSDRGTTVVMVTHREEATQVADRVLRLELGCLREDRASRGA